MLSNILWNCGQNFMKLYCLLSTNLTQLLFVTHSLHWNSKTKTCIRYIWSVVVNQEPNTISALFCLHLIKCLEWLGYDWLIFYGTLSRVLLNYSFDWYIGRKWISCVYSVCATVHTNYMHTCSIKSLYMMSQS